MWSSPAVGGSHRLSRSAGDRQLVIVLLAKNSKTLQQSCSSLRSCIMSLQLWSFSMAIVKSSLYVHVIRQHLYFDEYHHQHHQSSHDHRHNSITWLLWSRACSSMLFVSFSSFRLSSLFSLSRRLTLIIMRMMMMCDQGISDIRSSYSEFGTLPQYLRL